jgi:hypothetical protein
VGLDRDLSALLATGKKLPQRWAHPTPAVRGEIIREVAVVTINPAQRGRRDFAPRPSTSTKSVLFAMVPSRVY